jgi:DNA mismatch repair protein MutL
MTEPDGIAELDPETVDRIAAGEVVERPASAVKELVENAIDAGASRIDVSVKAGGTDRIAVSDDGVGMAEHEVRAAVRAHTTSKIRDIDDLESGVRTLGFRGEALHAIGSVSRLTVRTKPRGGDRGTELVMAHGEVTDVAPAGCPEGTTIEVTELFERLPARRKYLKREATEFDHVQRVVAGYALARPEVAVSLSHDGRERFATPGRGDRREAVMAVYGREVASAMVPVDAGEALPEGPLTRVTGLVSHPETNRAGREYLSTFVNGRYVTAGAVRDAVVAAYGSQLAPDRYPFAAVLLELDPASVDANVHPRKLEVRFADEAAAREQVREAVESALLEEGLLRSGAPRGASAPEEAPIDPEPARGGPADGAETTGSGTDSDSHSQPRSGPNSEGASDRDRTDDRGSASSSAPTPAEVGSGSGDSPAPEASAGPPGDPFAESGWEPSSDPESAGASPDRPSRELSDPHERPERRVEATEQRRLTDAEPEPEFRRLPRLRLLGQLQETYLVAESPEGMVVIDQHAADERVNYERLRERLAGDTTAQALAEPVRVELTDREAALFEPHREALAELGFRTELVDDRTVELRAVPAVLADAAGPDLLRDVLGSFVSGDAERTVADARDALLADLACYPSVTANVSLREGSVRALLEALDGCENPWACPHGRPTVVRIDETELEERFERDYPGHGGRRE